MKISCCLIGDDSLLIQCGEILLNNRHHITIIVSSTKKIRNWAKKHQILTIESIESLFEKKEYNNFDYVFSIVNSHILSESVINMARYAAINYHDSPLPSYAGLNSTSWAIINGEKNHGITWHLINNKIDQGDILKQQIFPIYEHDTAFTLNLRCYEFAIASFKELITDIEHQQLILKKQDLTYYSYYSKEHALPNFGFIDWENFSAERINRLYRGLTFGNYNNPVGTLKIYFPHCHLIISKLKMIDTDIPQAIPSTVIAIDHTGICISTTTKPIKITELNLATGASLNIFDFITIFKIYVGYRFKSASASDISMLIENHPTSLRHENYWLKSILNTTEHSIFSMSTYGEFKKQNINSTTINLKNIFSNKSIHSIKSALTASILIYLYRLNNHENTTVFFFHKDFKKLHNQCANFLPYLLPLNFNITNETLANTTLILEKNIQVLYQKNTYQNDITIRHPLLHGKSIEPNIVINFSAEQAISFLPDKSVLYFQINETEETIEIYHRFDLSLQSYIKELMSNISQHITNIFFEIIHNPHIPMKSCSFLMANERDKLLRILSAGEKKLIPGISIISLFEKQVILQPQHRALTINNIHISYYDLWVLSEKIANFINSQQLPEQYLIGVYFERGVEMIVTILGILKANSAYVPIDTKYPIARIKYIINETKISMLFTQEKFFTKITDYLKDMEHKTRIYCSKPIINENSAIIENSHSRKNCLENLAYVMFTSGTTGSPKGVMITQKNVLNYCYWLLKTTNFNSTCVMDFSCSIAFDLSIPCCIAPLLIGGTIGICPDINKINPKQYLSHLKKNHVTHLELTPGYMHLLLNYPDEIKELQEGTWLLLGADMVSKADVIKWLSLSPKHQLINEYGPTETTVAVTSYFIDPNNVPADSAVPIGRPSYNTQCYVLDKHQNLCPIGMIGELYVAGAQVARGYFNNLELTNEKFIVLNINNRQEVAYRTGDLVCWLPDGNLQFFGRNDSQIKIMGYRVETAEIQSVLESIPGINQAVVVIQNDKYTSNSLIAYLICDKEVIYDDEIRKISSSNLPAYMVPKEFLLIDSIPLKENEKIDYNALKKKEYTLLSSKFKKPLTEGIGLEKNILEIWQSIFHNNTITIHDDFFKIGGDSLTALKIIDELQQHCSIDIQVRYLFEYPTITLLSNKIHELVKSHASNNSRQQKKSHNSPIIQLSQGSYPTPLFLIHPVGGTVFWYKTLANLLQGKYTIYGIQDPNIDYNSLAFHSLEQMADYYISTIKSVYSGDYYNIGGASFGATVAFEMANQLTQLGNKIGSLCLLDGWAKYPKSIIDIKSATLLKNIDTDLTLNDQRRNDLAKLEEHRKILLENYSIPILPVDVSLFKAMNKWKFFEEANDHYNGWISFIQGRLTVYDVPGDHESMFFEPNVQTLARLLEKELKLSEKRIYELA